MFCDALILGFGIVLIQDKNVIVYASRQLKPYERKYPIHDLKLHISGVCIKDLETLYLWCQVWGLHRPSYPKIHVYLKIFEPKAAEMEGFIEGLSVSYSKGQYSSWCIKPKSCEYG